MFVLPFLARLGTTGSWSGWRLDAPLDVSTKTASIWTVEGIAVAHVLLAGLLWAASLWHWVFWDLDLFRDRRSNNRVIDSPNQGCEDLQHDVGSSLA